MSDVAALIQEAEEEIRLFERPSLKTSKRLIEALKQLNNANGDTRRLEWVAENSAAIRKGGEQSPDPYFFVIHRNGATSHARSDLREAIDVAMNDIEMYVKN